MLALLTVRPASSQTPAADAQTLQALLAEVRALHSDVRLGQTTQILLAELEVQQSAVNRATQHRDDLRAKVLQAQLERRTYTDNLARLEDALNAAADPTQKKRSGDMVDRVKNDIANVKLREQEYATNLREAEVGLQTAQNTLDDIQSQLHETIKRLQPANTH